MSIQRNRTDARISLGFSTSRLRLAMLVVFVLAASGAWGANATWTGSGDGFTWESDANWSAAYPGTTSGDIATFTGTPATVNITSYAPNFTNVTVNITGAASLTISAPMTVTSMNITGGATLTLGANMTVTTLNVNTNSTVTINLNTKTLTATTVNFGLSGSALNPGVNVHVNGVGTIATTTFDTNEKHDNTIDMENYAYLSVSGTFYGDNDLGTGTYFTSTDGTCTISATTGVTGLVRLYITNITIVNSTYSLSVSPNLGPGVTSTVTMRLSGTPNAAQYRYVLTITNAGGTTEQYRVNGGTWYSTSQPMAQLGAASSTLTIECSASIDAADGVALTVYLPDGITQIGKLTYIQGYYIWLGGSASWSAGSNWSTGSAPSAAANVVIIQQTSNNPTLDTGSAVTVGPLTIQGNATLNLGTQSLTATSLTVQSAGTLNVGTGTFTATSYSLVGTGKISAASGTVAFAGAASWSCAQPLNQTIAALTVNVGATLNAINSLYATGTLTNNNAITMASGTTLSFGAYTGSAADSVSTTAGTIAATGAGGSIRNLNITTSASLQGGSGATGIVVTNSTGGSTAITTTGKVAIHGAGITSLTASSGTLTLNGATTATTVSVNGTSVLSQFDNTCTLGATTLNLGNGSAASLTNNAALTVGTLTVNTSSSGDVTLANTGNSFTNNIVLTSGGAVSIYDTTSLGISGSASTSLTLQSASTVTQPATQIINTPILRVQAAGGITLNEANTISSTFCASNITSGNVSLTNTGSLTLGDATLASVSTASGGTVTIANTGGVTIARAVSAGTGTVRIRSGAGAIANGTGTITADTIYLQDGTGAGAVGASGAGNSVLLATSNPGTTTTTLYLGGGNAVGAYVSHTGALTLAAPSLATNAPLSVVATELLTPPASPINTGAGALTLTSGTSFATGGNLTSTSTVTLTANGGTMGVAHSVSGTTVTLLAFDTLSQSAGTLSGTNLSAKTRKAGGAAITLNQTTNDFDSVSLLSRDAADGADQAGIITFVDADGFDVDTAGIHSTALVRLTAGGAVTNTGTILSGSLALRGAGSYTLNSANVVGKLAAALTGGSLNFTNSAAFGVDTVDTLPGIVLSNSTSTMTLTAGANTITLYQGLTTNAGEISITTSPVSLGATVTVTNGGTMSATAPIGFPSTIISATPGSFGLTLTAGSSNISITGAVGGGGFPLASVNVTSAAQTTFGGDVTTTSTQSITSTTIRTNGTHSTTNNAVAFTGNLTLQANTILSAGNSTIDITGTVNGNFTLAANATGLTTLGDNIGTTTALAGLTTDLNGDTSFGGSTIRTQGGGTITLNDQLRLSVDATLDTTNNAGYSAGANLALASVDANTHALTLNSGTAGILSSSANIEEVTTFTITNCASAAFAGSVGLVGTPITTVALAATINTTSAIAFNNGLFATAFTVNAGAAAYDVTLGATGTVTNHVTFNNTGDLTISGGFTFTNGATKSTAGVTHIAGTISSSDQPFTFNGAGGVTLDNNATIDTNATNTNTADITLGAVTGSTFTLTLETGNAVANADVAGTSFTGTGTFALQNIGGTATFTGAVSPASFTVLNTVANVSLQGTSGTITNPVQFHNTGTLRLGSTGTLTFNGGVSTVTAPAVGGTVTLYGTIATSNDPISFGAVALGAATLLNPGSGQIDLGSIPSAANFNLDIQGTGTANLGSGGTDFLLGTGALILSSKTTVSPITIDGTTVTLDSITPPGTPQTIALTFNANTVTVTAAATLTNVGVLTLGNADTDTFNFNGGLTKVGTNAAHLRGTLDTSAGTGGIDITTSGGIGLYGVTTMKTGTANLQLGAVTCDVAAGHNLVIYGSGTGTATIASANLGTTGSLDLTNRSSTGTFTLSGSLTALDLIAPSSAAAFNLILNGGSTTNGVDLTNQTGALTINSGGFSFNGGANKPTGNITLAGGSVLTDSTNALDFGTSGTISVTANTTIGGNAAGDTATITLSTVNISATFTLTLGSGTENTSYSVTGAINGGGSLTINTAGSSGTVTLGANVGAGTALAALTVTNSYGVEFQGSVRAGTVTLTDTANGQDIIFRGDLTVTTGLTTGAQPFDLFFNATVAGTQTTTITGNVNLQIVSTGTITFGNNAGDVFIVNGTLTSNGTATRHLIGAIRTQAQTITFGSVTLDGDTTIDTTANGNASYLAGATISLGAVTDGGTNTLVVNAGTAGGFTQSAGTITADRLRLIAGGNIGTALASPVNIAVTAFEAKSATGTIFVSNSGALTLGFPGGAFDIAGSLITSTVTAYDIGLEAVDLVITENLDGIGSLTLRPRAAATTVSVGAAGGALALDDTDLGFITDGFSGITLGRADSGAVTVNTAAFLDPVMILGGGTITIAAGSPSLSTTQDNASITVTAAAGFGIVVNGGVTAHGSGAIDLNSGAAFILANVVDIASTSGNITIDTTGSNDMTINGTVATTGTGTVTLTASRSILMDTDSVISSGSGAIIMDADAVAAGSLVLDVVSSASGQITLRSGSGGSITEADNTALISTAGLLYLNDAAEGASIGGMGTAAINTSVASVRGQTSGNLYLSEADALGLGDAGGGLSSSAGLIDIVAGSTITVANNVSAATGITIATSAGSIERSAGTLSSTAGSLALTATGGHIGVDAGGDGTVDGTWISTSVVALRATATAGGIYVSEANAIQLGDGTSGLSATNGEIRVTTAGAITTGNAITTTTSGNIALTAGGVGITITNNVNSAGSAAFNSAVSHSAGTITAGPVAAGSTALLFTGTYTGVGGTIVGNGTTDPDIEFRGNGTNVLGTFTHNGDRMVFSGGASPLVFNSSNQELSDVLITGGTSVQLIGSNVSQTGASLQIASGGLNLNGFYWRQDSSATATPTVGEFYGRDGTLTLAAGSSLQCVALTSELGHTITNSGANTITASGNVTVAGTFSPPLANSTLVMTGAAATLDATPRIGNLTIQGNVTLLNNPLELQGNMHILATGSFDVGANLKITLYGNWTNDAGPTGFLARAGEVEFVNASGPIVILGNNNWFKFRCEQPGVTIRFGQNQIQTILAGGSFIITGINGSNIKLTRDGNQTDDLGWSPPLLPNPLLMWQIDLIPPATLPIQYADVFYSDARLHPVVASTSVHLGVATNIVNGGTTDATCYKWLTGIPALYSYTEDSDGNGKIDRIRVTAAATPNFNFSGFEVSVTGYDIDTTKGTRGFIPGVSQDFYIALVEKAYLDTGAKPTWKILKNTTLRDQAFNLSSVTTVDPVMTPVDNAPPVLAYTLSLPGVAQTFMVFSENVWGAGGAVLNISDVTYGPAVNLVRITAADSGTSEAILNLSAAPTPGYLQGAPTLTLSATVNDTASPAPTDYSTVDISYPAPAYQATGTPPPNAILHPTHRVTDVLISVPPSSAADANYFVWPIWAKDSVITEIASEDYEGLTAEEAASRTIGLVRDFTGTQWLRDQDITLQARVSAGLGTPTALRLYYDTNVPETFLSTAANGPVGLWLPSFSPSKFSGLVPTPRSGTSAVASGAPVAPLLWNLAIDSKDPKVKSVSVFDFFFTLGAENAVDPLYVARLDIAPGAAVPADWYRHIKPFSFEIHDVKKQRSSVTILNNVIDPTKGERVRISYQLNKGGSTTIQVFTLDGDLVDVLYRGNRAAGDYTASWDGKNRGGRAVARGMYFIRVVGPEIDEIRKVMIVK